MGKMRYQVNEAVDAIDAWLPLPRFAAMSMKRTGYAESLLKLKVSEDSAEQYADFIRNEWELHAAFVLVVSECIDLTRAMDQALGDIYSERDALDERVQSIYAKSTALVIQAPGMAVHALGTTKMILRVLGNLTPSQLDQAPPSYFTNACMPLPGAVVTTSRMDDCSENPLEETSSLCVSSRYK